MAVDVFDHHNRVIDQDANRKNQRKQRDAVQRKAPGPRGKQGGRQRQPHGHANDQRLAPAQGKKHQGDHAGGGKQQFLNQLLRLVVGRGTVVARFGHLHLSGDDGVAQLFHALHHGLGHVDGVGPGFFRYCQGDGRIFSGLASAHLSMPDIALRRPGAIGHSGDVFQKDGLALAGADHDVGHLLGAGQQRPGLERDGLVAAQQLTQRQALVGRLQSAAHLVHRDGATGHAGRIQLYQHGAAGAADGGHGAGTGHAHQLGLDAVGHALQGKGAAVWVIAEQGEGDHRDIVNALGADDGLLRPQAARQPVGVAAQGVVQAHQRLGAWHAHRKLHRQHRHAGARDAHHMLYAQHLRQHLLGGRGNHLLDIAHRRAGEGHDDVGHGHVDLRLFFAWGDQHGKQAQQQRQQGQ